MKYLVFFALLAILAYCGPQLTNKDGSTLTPKQTYRITDRVRFADVNDAPHRFHNRASDPTFGEYFLLIADSHFCVVNEREFILAFTGELHQCDWRFIG